MQNMTKLRLWMCLLGLIVLLVGCNRTTIDDQVADALSPSPSPSPSPQPPSLTISSPTEGETIAGNTVELGIQLSGMSLVPADGDTSGRTGHIHVFIDRDPVPVGQPIPQAKDIEHSALNPVLITGLARGTHRFVVVLGNGNHVRIDGPMDEVTVTLSGPSIDVTGPATASAGKAVTIAVKLDGISLVRSPDGQSPRSGHLHVLVDKLPEFGKAIPAEEGIIHTVDRSIRIEGLSPGRHVIYVIVGDGGHVPFRPLVADKIVIEVS